MSKTSLILGVSGFILTHSFSSVAAQATSDEIVSVGQLTETVAVSDLTSPISLITETELDARNQAFLSDILRSLPGISVSRSGAGGALTQLRLRGSEANQILVIIDGIEVANPSTGEFDFAGLRAEDIVRIELLRGEQSALYGSDAIGGVLNIITQAGRTEPNFSISTEVGSLDTFNSQISATVPMGAAAVTVTGGGLTTEGFDVSDTNGEKDGSDSRSLNIGVNNVGLGPLTLTGKIAYQSLISDFDEDSDFDGRLNDTRSETSVESLSLRLGAQIEALGFDHRLSVSRQNTRTDTVAGFSTFSEGERDQARWVASRDMGIMTLSLLGELEEERYEISPNFAASPTNPENQQAALAADLSTELGALDLNLSVRQDFNDRFDDATTWKIGGGYDIARLNGRIRASVGTGVKNPSLIELFGFFPESNFVGNPDLQPETSLGFNIGYTQSWLDGAASFSVDYFNATLEDEIFTDFSSFPSVARNRSTQSEREGVEFEARWSPIETFNLRGSATLLDATENGIEEIRRPEFLASASFMWSPAGKLSLSGQIDHTGSQLDTDFATFSPVRLDAFTLVGANIAYDLTERVSVTLRGENLLDEDYEEIVGFQSQGASVFAGLRARFR